jgi:endonuclease-3
MAEPKRIIEILLKKYPDPKIELNFSNPLQLLVATILSAQCTDRKVNEVTKGLFKKYKGVEDYAETDPGLLEKDLKGITFAKQKAGQIVKACRILIEKHGGQVPDSMEALTELPGVGRKTANVVLGSAFGRPAIAVDTHVLRVSNRLGLTESKVPERVEEDLMRKIPREKWTPVNLAMILHGRYTCKAKKPLCGECVLYEECEWEEKDRYRERRKR